ncbi:transcription initiation factor IIB, partial [Nowakowskiella sp. JEL0078]
GDLVCGSCGLVLGNRIIDTRSEWRTFANDDGGDDPSRVGAPTDGLRDTLDATTISGLDGGSGQAKELTKAHRRAVGQKGERELLNAFRDIQSLCERENLNKSVIEYAKHLFKKADDKKLTKGKSPTGFIAACIYIACKERNGHRTFKEIGALAKVLKKDMGKCYKILQAEGLIAQQQVPSTFDAHINRFCSQLSLPLEVKSGAKAVARRLQELGTLEGRSPITVVAACIFFVSSMLQEPRNIHLIAEIAGCADATLKHAYKLLYAIHDQLIQGNPKLEPHKEHLPI